MAWESAVLGWGPAGREEFWERVIRKVGPRIRAYIAKSGCVPEEVEELAADVFVVLVELEEDFVACNADWKFVHPILRRICAAAVRRRRHELPLSDAAVSSIPSAPSSDVSEAHLEQVRIWGVNLIRALPFKQRKAFRLCVLESRSCAEAAAMTGSSGAAVRFNLYAARKRLRQLAQGCPPPEA